ncbi:MAG: hypothetical protein HC818_03090 [Synechococcaceae cyanobacterium RM1_1_27]|nr:hypothetical protein [Synechococcaceae cyanobacterium RM1_1_27]
MNPNPGSANSAESFQSLGTSPHPPLGRDPLGDIWQRAFNTLERIQGQGLSRLDVQDFGRHT